MRRALIVYILLFALVAAAHAQSPITVDPVNGVTQTWSSGAAISRGQIVKMDVNGRIVPVAITDTKGALGVAVTGTGDTGQTVIVAVGPGNPLTFVDGVCAVGDSIIISTITLGAGHCMSSPTGQVIGVIPKSTAGGFITIQMSPLASAGTSGTSIPSLLTLNGIAKGNGAGVFSAALAADIYGLWSGTCNNTTFLRGDGSCQTPAGGGGSPAGSAGNLQYYSGGVFAALGTTISGVNITFPGTVTAVGLNGSGSGNISVPNASLSCPAGGCAGLSTLSGDAATNSAFINENGLGFVCSVARNFINAQVGTSYTTAGSDCHKLVTFNNAAATTVIVQPPLASGHATYYFNIGGGLVTLNPNLAPPMAPSIGASGSGGSLGSSVTVFVVTTFVNANGETTVSPESSVQVGSGTTNSVTVTAPTLPITATGYTAYSSLTTGTELKQGASNACVNITANCVIQVIGAGAAIPGTNTARWGTINGANSMPFRQNSGALVSFDGTNLFAMGSTYAPDILDANGTFSLNVNGSNLRYDTVSIYGTNDAWMHVVPSSVNGYTVYSDQGNKGVVLATQGGARPVTLAVNMLPRLVVGLDTPLNSTGNTANLAATTIYTTLASGVQGAAGMYRVCLTAYVTATGSATAIVPNVLYNNGNSITRILPTLSTAALTNVSDGCVVLYSAASQAIQVNTTGYSGTGTFAIRGTMEQLQ
jgi:hypothetical protein